MTKTSHILTIAAFAAALAGGSAFAQTSSTDAMKKDDHMASGQMTSGDHMKGKKKKDDHMSSGAMTSAPKQ